jgi:hypothetical protein
MWRSIGSSSAGQYLRLEKVDQVDEGGCPKCDAEQRAPTAQQVDRDRDGESDEGVKGRFRQRDDAVTEGANRKNAQNSDGHPSGELFDQDRFLDGPKNSEWHGDIKGASADL